MHSRNLISTFANIILPLKRGFFQKDTSEALHPDALFKVRAWLEVLAEVQDSLSQCVTLGELSLPLIYPFLAGSKDEVYLVFFISLKKITRQDALPFIKSLTLNEQLFINQSNAQHQFSDHQFNTRTWSRTVGEGDKETQSCPIIHRVPMFQALYI